MSEKEEIFQPKSAKGGHPLDRAGQHPAEKQPAEVAENLLTAIEAARKRVLARIARKRKKLLKFVGGLGEDFQDLTAKWSTSFVTATLAAGIFLTTAAPITAASLPKIEARELALTVTEKESLRYKILAYLQNLGRKRKVNPQVLASLVSQITGLAAKSAFDGNKIPAVFGEIATEKHLMIYPGQKLSDHLANAEDFDKYHSVGMSTKAGAWGYFAPNRNSSTEEQILSEKYYLVIQTFAAERWTVDWPTLKEWYKFRKLLVYNPENGKTVVGVLADAGPAQYTRRAFGGSPEVMEGLGLSETKTQGDVLVFFLDDPENLIPPGTISQDQLLVVEEQKL